MKYIIIIASLLFTTPVMANDLLTRVDNFWKYTGAVAGLYNICGTELHKASIRNVVKIHDIIRAEISDYEYQSTVSPLINHGFAFVHSLDDQQKLLHCQNEFTIMVLMKDIINDADLVLSYYQRKKL